MASQPDWQTILPKDAGFDPERLSNALDFARRNESDWPRDMYKDGVYIGCVDTGDPAPFNRPFGRVFPRGGANGLILRQGRLVAEWGDTRRADVTFSVAKSYLALLAGLAIDRGLIGSVDDRVALLVDDGGFEGANAEITWRHLLEQSSEWQGVLFEIPDSVDWNRRAGPSEQGATANKGAHRELRRPGAHFEYNDVRVNRLSLSLLRVFGTSLPEILAQNIMSAIGASSNWDWHGYATSTVDIGGRKIESVSGGSHWGGGLRISARDHARVGEMVLGGGAYGRRQILSELWIEQMLTPSVNNPNYGFMWWLNTNGTLYAPAPETSVFGLGGGSNMIWIDRPRDLVVVARWVRKSACPDLIAKIMQAM